MIIFDLDGTLADCSHRKHFVTKPDNVKFVFENIYHTENGSILSGNYYNQFSKEKWNPDWESFYEACDTDLPINPVIEMMDGIYFNYRDKDCFLKNVQIWSGRCESVRDKTIAWLDKFVLFDDLIHDLTIKMRPIGDYTPDDILKERWLDEALAQGKKIEYVFDDRPKVVRMWRRRGIFVFNCNQTDEKF